jgi:predicted amino acid-binding ACT domain protein
MLATARAPDSIGRTYFLTAEPAVSWRDVYRAAGEAAGREMTTEINLPQTLVDAAGILGDVHAWLTGTPTLVTRQKIALSKAEFWVCSGARAMQDFGFRAGIGLREGMLNEDLYAALLLVVLVTTLVTPPLLSWRLGRLRKAPSVAATGPPPEDGWLVVDDGVVTLRTGPAESPRPPPPHAALDLGLQASLLLANARPGPALLDWLSSAGDPPVTWDRGARSAFFDLLRHGNARSWRFLEMTGLLARALPEVADAVDRRRADPYDVDPAGALRFTLADRVHDLLGKEELEHPERLALAALLVDLGATVPTARRVVKRLDMGAAAEQDVALLVGESDLLRAAAARADGLDEERVVQIASHLDRPERARALYLLSLALGDLEPWHRQRLDALAELLQATLSTPELAARGTRNLVEQRRAAAVRLAGEATPAAARLEHAPRAWLLNQDPADAARLAQLLEPPPPRGNVRVDVLELDDGLFRVEVACRDRRGLLASITGGLVSAGIEVLDASAATWPDGGAVDAFVVRSPAPPEPEVLRARLADARKEPLAADGVPDAEVTFDDAASPWYTLCSVEAPDRPGLLHALTTAFADSGADVHSARITTREGSALDHFELSNGGGSKLGAAARDGVTRAIRQGVGRGGSRWRAKAPRDRNNRLTDRKQSLRSVASGVGHPARPHRPVREEQAEEDLCDHASGASEG